MLKIKLFIAVILSVFSINVFAETAVIKCNIADSQGMKSYRQEFDVSKNFEYGFQDRKFQEVKFKVSYSNLLKTCDTLIRDDALQVEVLGTEWANSTPKGAHSAVRLSTPKGDFILSCAIY